MQTILAAFPTSNIAIRELLETVFRLRRRLLLVVGTILLAAQTTALLISPTYRAESSVLVMPGADHPFSSPAGTTQAVNQALERTEMLGTELAILDSRDLHRQVLQEVGLATVYPDLLARPGLPRFADAALRALLPGLWRGHGAEAGPASPTGQAVMEHGLDQFQRDVSALASAESNTINLTYTHRDPVMAAKILAALERLYLQQRRVLFADLRSGTVVDDAARLRERLDEADRRLADFKLAHDISSFPTRQDILLHAQGDAENSLMEAQSEVDQQKARVTQLQSLIATTPKQIASEDIDVEARLQAMRSNLDALISKRADLAARYKPDGTVTQTLDAQIALRQREMARSRADRTASGYRYSENPIYIEASTDLMRAQADLQAAQARQQKLATQIDGIVEKQRAMNQLERAFSDLERQRQQAQESVTTAARLAAERMAIEQVRSSRQSDAKILSEAVEPITPAPTRTVIMLAAGAVAAAACVGMVLTSLLARRGFLLAGALERDCGIPVLVVIPDLETLPGGRPGAIRPA